MTIDTIQNTNVNVTQRKNFTDAEQRFSVQYPAHWAVTQSGNRFTDELPLVANDVNGSDSKVQSQLSINVFKTSQSFNPNEVSYRSDPLSFDMEQATMDHIIESYLLLKN